MARRIFQILRGPSTSKPTLQKGEFYLDTTNDVVYMQGNNSELRFALQSDLSGYLPVNGTATAASKLATSGTVRVSLGSTSSVTYTNGGNITPGVNGLLPVTNGGTGINNAQPMRKSGTLTLTTTWSGSEGNYTQNVSVTGITAAAVPIVIPQITTTAQQTAWNLLTPKVNANAGSITFYSATKTTTAVSFIVLWAV